MERSSFIAYLPRPDHYRETLMHVAFLNLFLMTQGLFCGVPSLDSFALIGFSASWLDILALSAIALVLTWLSPRKMLLRTGVAALYVMLIVELRYRAETGLFFSLPQALYAWQQRDDLAQVILPTIVDHTLPGMMVMALICLLVPVLSAPGRLDRKLAYGVLGLTLFMACLSPSASLFTALTAPHQTLTNQATASYPYQQPQLSTRPATLRKPPDILIIVLESTRAQVVPGFGGPGAKAAMPYLQHLMDHGLSFDHAYTTTSLTTKALVGILCGIHPNPAPTIHEAQPGGLPTCLPHLLEQAGYRSLFITSAPLSFQENHALVSNLGFQRQLDRDNISRGYRHVGYFGTDEMALVGPLQSWWQAPTTAPRLAVVLTSMTHHPYQELGKPEPKTKADQWAGYQANLTYTDTMLKQLLTTLGQHHGLDNSLIVITGDHGEGFGEHGRYDHPDVPFEEGIRVPLLLLDSHHPDRHGVDHGLRQHIDIMPTLLDLTGLPFSGQLPGKDVLGPGHEYVLTSCWNFNPCMSRVEADGRKWILFQDEGRLASYRLDQDPQEQHDLAAAQSTAANDAIIDSMLGQRVALQRLYQQHFAGAPGY